MYLKCLSILATALVCLGCLGCNLGPESPGEVGQQSWDQDAEALTWHGAPPTCYGLRHYYQWVCRDGDWKLTKVGQRDIWCDGTVFLSGEETDCYSDFATYDCNSGGSCGDYQHVCTPKPTRFCRRPIFVGPVQVAAP